MCYKYIFLITHKCFTVVLKWNRNNFVTLESGIFKLIWRISSDCKKYTDVVYLVYFKVYLVNNSNLKN